MGGCGDPKDCDKSCPVKALGNSLGLSEQGAGSQGIWATPVVAGGRSGHGRVHSGIQPTEPSPKPDTEGHKEIPMLEAGG